MVCSCGCDCQLQQESQVVTDWTIQFIHWLWKTGWGERILNAYYRLLPQIHSFAEVMGSARDCSSLCNGFFLLLLPSYSFLCSDMAHPWATVPFGAYLHRYRAPLFRSASPAVSPNMSPSTCFLHYFCHVSSDAFQCLFLFSSVSDC